MVLLGAQLPPDVTILMFGKLMPIAIETTILLREKEVGKAKPIKAKEKEKKEKVGITLDVIIVIGMAILPGSALLVKEKEKEKAKMLGSAIRKTQVRNQLRGESKLRKALQAKERNGKVIIRRKINTHAI